MPRNLPDVTLVAIDCVAHDLTRSAIEDTLKQITPKEVLIWSNKRLYNDALYMPCELHSLDDVANVLWYDVPSFVKTSHFLLIQYDGWVLDESLWRDEWLSCDYIGAPWPWHKDGLNVGNGGFSLRSTEMARFIRDGGFEFRSPEDDILCRYYRPALERLGFKWATDRQAQIFSCERGEWKKAFGFHGLFNFKNALDPDSFGSRLLMINDFVRSKPEFQELVRA